MKTKKSEVKPIFKIKQWCENYPGKRPPRFLRAFMLYILAQSPNHGFKIIEILQDMGIKYEDIGDSGYIYKILNAMEKDQVIISYRVINDKNQEKYKIIYTLTDKGKSELKLWILSLSNLEESLEGFLQAFKNIENESL